MQYYNALTMKVTKNNILSMWALKLIWLDTVHYLALGLLIIYLFKCYNINNN